MYLIGIGTACPPQRYTKTECWHALQASPWFERLDRRARIIVRRVLQRDNGIEARRLAVESLEAAFDIDPDVLYARFVTHAPRLASNAARRAMTEAGVEPAELDALIVSTCTGYLCPGLSSYVLDALGLRGDILALDLVGQGCGAALPNLRTAEALLASQRCRHVLSVCVEVCSAAIYLDNDPGVLVSACLFGDGAGAAVLSAQSCPGKRAVEWGRTASIIDPRERDALRFETRAGMLRNMLAPEVPQLAAAYAHRVLTTALDAQGLQHSDIKAWIMHAGGPDVLAALRQRLDLGEDDLRRSADMLREYGNMSSAFVFFVLQQALAESAPGGWWWLASFGAGFSSHGALLRVSP